METGPRLALQAFTEPSSANKRALSEAGENRELFGLAVVAMYAPPLDSCDSIGIARATDDHRYLVKGYETWPSLPLSELLCHEICHRCGIPVPPWRILTLLDGSPAFGSRWVPDTFSYGGILNTPAQMVQRLSNPEALKRIFLLDLFFHNLDRHWNNIVFAPLGNGDKVQAFPIDFSRAFLFHAFPLPGVDRLPRDCHTLVTARSIFAAHGISSIDVRPTLAKLQEIEVDQISRILGNAPTSWKQGLNPAMLLDWWSSNLRMERIQSIRQGIEDDSILRLRRP